MSNGLPDKASQNWLAIRSSILLVRYVTAIGIGWVIFAYLLAADWLLLAALIATIGCLFGIVLHKIEWHLSASLVWLSSASAAVFLASLVTPPEGHMSFIFVAFAAMPFIALRQGSQAFWFIAMVLLPIALWSLAWALDYNVVEEYDVSRAIAEKFLAPASAATTFGVVLFITGFFVRTSNKHLEAVVTASEELRKSNEAKMRLLDSLSHEMRSPLQAVYGYADLIQIDAKNDAKNLRENSNAYSTHILKACLDMLTVLDDIFEFVRRPETPAPLQLENVVVRLEIEKVIRGRVNEVSFKKLAVTVDVSPDVTIHTDKYLVRQAVRPLIENAIKFSNDNGSVRVSSETGDESINIVVTDTGPGFPAGASKTAFIPFERLGFETSTTPDAGIGLSLAQEAAERLGGHILIDENYKEGARVTLSLPTRRRNDEHLRDAGDDILTAVRTGCD